MIHSIGKVFISAHTHAYTNKHMSKQSCRFFYWHKQLAWVFLVYFNFHLVWCFVHAQMISEQKIWNTMKWKKHSCRVAIKRFCCANACQSSHYFIKFLRLFAYIVAFDNFRFTIEYKASHFVCAATPSNSASHPPRPLLIPNTISNNFVFFFLTLLSATNCLLTNNNNKLQTQ